MTDTLELLKRIRDDLIDRGYFGVPELSEEIWNDLEAKIAELEAEPKGFTEAEQAIDDALVCCHLGTLNDFPTIKHALAAVERWHYDLGASGVCEPATHKLVASMENPYGREYRPVEPPTPEPPTACTRCSGTITRAKDASRGLYVCYDCKKDFVTEPPTAQPTEDLGAVMEKYGIDVFESLKGQWAAVHIEGYTLRDTPLEAVLALRDKLEGE